MILAFGTLHPLLQKEVDFYKKLLRNENEVYKAFLFTKFLWSPGAPQHNLIVIRSGMTDLSKPGLLCVKGEVQ